MPKRHNHRDTDEIHAKIRKLERELARSDRRRERAARDRRDDTAPPSSSDGSRDRRPRRRRRRSGSAATSRSHSRSDYNEDEVEADPNLTSATPAVEPAVTPAARAAPTLPAAAPIADHSLADEVAENVTTAAEAPIPWDIIAALGDGAEEAPNYGENINEEVGKRWTAILKTGLPKEAKEKLLKEYLVPANCTLLKAPKLNPEISLTVNETSKARDRKIEAEQGQLGLGLAAIGEALTLLISSTTVDKVKVVQKLSDGARILSDLHFHQTEIRRKIIAMSLDKSFNSIATEAARDELLFGDKLAEKIRTTKSIEKSGLQIKRHGDNTKKDAIASTSTRRLNWNGPPRQNAPGARTTRGRGGGPKPRTAAFARNPTTASSGAAGSGGGGQSRRNYNQPPSRQPQRRARQ